MAQHGLKPPGPLLMEDDLATSWESWIQDFEIYSVAAGVATKAEKIQCCVFLHIAAKAARNVY